MGNGGVMAMAGLLEGWKDPSKPRRGMAADPHHHHDGSEQPYRAAILGFEAWPKWLGEEPANETELKALLWSFPAERLAMWAVDRKVGNVKNEGPELIERIAA